MPMLTVHINTAVPEENYTDILTDLSKAVAAGLGKPENFVMVSLHPKTPLMFAGHTAPAAAVELASIRLAASQTEALSASLCQLIGSRLGIAVDRIFIIFRDVERPFWGWNGGTF